jgi:SpoVK/Ycf46/Vps4 family AAA+-type ATPase
MEALQQLPPQFWKLDPIEYLGVSDWSSLETSNLSFGEIHRLSSLLAGMSSEEPFGPDRLKRALRHLTASDNIKFEWAEQGRTKDRPISDDKTSKLRKTATKHEKRLLGGVIEPDKIKTTFNDVHAPVETIEALKTLTTLSLIRPESFLYGVLATDKIPGLLLYGPPGTGKTMLAKAVAKESGAAMLEVSAAEINDMYVGEGEKNVKALFSLAKKLAPCVVFIDEADALFSSRTSGHQRVSHRELLNQF